MRLAVKLFRDAQVTSQQGSSSSQRSSRSSRRNRGSRVRGVTRLGVRAVCEPVDSAAGVVADSAAAKVEEVKDAAATKAEEVKEAVKK